jgi:GT2 family glycosyltransferase
MNVLVVIVNYRTPSLTIDCLQSLAPEIARHPGTQVIVTDNKSPDDSVQQIGAAIDRLGYGAWCRFAPLPENGGFAYGNNEAIKLAMQNGKLPFDAVWLLNPDTLVLENALGALIEFVQTHPHVGIAGGRAENRDGSVRRSSFRFHTALGELEGALQFGLASKALAKYRVAPGIPDKAERVEWVSGASMMIRRAVIEKIGLLDAGYFMYYEETDYCLRAARAGFECWYVPQSRIIHLVGQSSGVTGAKRGAKRRPKYWFDSRARYFRNNFGRVRTHGANIAWMSAYPLGRLWQMVRGKTVEDPPRLWWDFVRYNYFGRKN